MKNILGYGTNHSHEVTKHMSEKMKKCGIKREQGYLYFLNKEGNVARVKQARGKGTGDKKQEVVCVRSVNKEAGYLYFLDKDGDISRAKQARGRK